MRIALLLTCTLAATVSRAATFTIVDDDTKNQALRDAITAANLTPEADLIVLPASAPPPDGGPREPTFSFGASPFPDAEAGNIVLTPITSDITIEGPGSDECIIRVGDGVGTLFLVATDPTLPPTGLELPARLTLRGVTIQNGSGPMAGAIVVKGTPPPTGELPGLVLQDVVFEGNHGDQAGAIVNLGAPIDASNVDFLGNFSPGAGAVVTASGGVFLGTDWIGNNRDAPGAVGAIEATAATYTDDAGDVVDAELRFGGSSFENNDGVLAGAVRSVATTRVNGTDFIGNRAGSGPGAILARSLTINSGDYTDNESGLDGGAVSLTNTPVGAAASVSFAFFANNRAEGLGGAVHAVDVGITITDSDFNTNVAAAGGGAVYVRNNVTTILRSSFQLNVARPSITFSEADGTLDERGDDVATFTMVAQGSGSALYAFATTALTVSDSCFIANANAAVFVQDSPTVSADLNDNFWNANTGPGAAGDGDSLVPQNATVASSAFLANPPDACTPLQPRAAAPLDLTLLLGAADTATVGTDYTVVNRANGLTILTANPGLARVPMRLGRFTVEVRGENDLDDEEDESLSIGFPACTGSLDACPEYVSNGQTTFAMTITDNGDAIGEGEGEGEVDPCLPEDIAVAPDTVQLPDLGDEVSRGEVVVTNKGPCPVRLFQPGITSGASSGFETSVVPQADLLLDTGKRVTITVKYKRPDDLVEEEPAEGEEAGPLTGTLAVETQGGARKEVKLVVTEGCGCTSSRPVAPSLWALGALGLLCLTSVKRRTPSRPT